MDDELARELGATLGIYKEHFLPLLLPIIERAVEAEREACAKIAQAHKDDIETVALERKGMQMRTNSEVAHQAAALCIRDAIRARSQDPRSPSASKAALEKQKAEQAKEKK